MTTQSFAFTSIIAYLAACSHPAFAATITWTAQNPDNDMNESTNWSPNTIPGNSDNAVFDNTILGIDTNPNDNGIPFSVSTFTFPHSASIFNFYFNNTVLNFNGLGITGSAKNPFIYIANIDNSSFIGDLISFSGPTGTIGSASITIFNSAALTGSISSGSLGNINSNVYSTGSFTVANSGKITASNVGVDSTHGTGGNSVADTGVSQLSFDDTFTAGNNVIVSVVNNGTYSGTNTTQGNNVGVVNGSQFLSGGAFQVGDDFNVTVQNEALDSSSGIGLSNVGRINAAQMLLQTTAVSGDNCSITISNMAENSSQPTGFSENIGYLNDYQFFVGSTFQAGNDFSLDVTNTGMDTSSGNGAAQVAVINSNSGTSGHQVFFAEGCDFGNDATISTTNSGSYSGTNTNGGSSVGLMNLGQVAFGDLGAPGSYVFNAGDNFTLTASSTGVDSCLGVGGDVVGCVSSDQIIIYTPCSWGNNAHITVTKSGTYSGLGSASFVNVGSSGGCQFSCVSTFQAGDNLLLNISNSGTHTGSGIGLNFIGDIITGQQISFNEGMAIGDNAIINISNMGSNSSNTTVYNQVGSLMGYGKQLLIKESLIAGDNLVLTIANSGFDDSIGEGGNYVGFINNNSVDQSASQLHLDNEGSLGNNAAITLTNTGTYQGSTSGSGNIIGSLAGEQFLVVSNFSAGNRFSLGASNAGTSNASGQNGQTIGLVGSGGQVAFGGECDLGNDATIILSNSGVNHDATGTSNAIGTVAGSQMSVVGNFTAGTNLYLSANNTATNDGDGSNSVGNVNGSQFLFEQGCLLNDGTLISAFNSGTVLGSQIVFGQGFDIQNGKVSIQAINDGAVNDYGIDIQGSNAGGNADILLQNNSLHVETTLPTFAIASLTGDSTSVVQSKPTFIINTNSETHTEFAGAIQDFPSLVSSLTKRGGGTQKLSGANTYTGLTTIQEGTLVVSGSIAGDVNVTGTGILKGSGTIAGDVTNTSKIAPGESIGTITFLSDFYNNGGEYDVEVNALGQSDLINVGGNAVLNGGLVEVSSDDGTYAFQQAYTIMDVAGSISGQFSQVTAVSPLVKPILSYDTNHAYLTLFTEIVNAATSSNQLAVALQLDEIQDPSPSLSLLLNQIVNLPLAGASNALSSLSGYQHTNDFLATQMMQRQFIRRLYDPLRNVINTCTCTCEEPVHSWFEIGNSFLSAKGNDNAHGFNMDGYNFAGGIQATFCDEWTFGIAGEYEHNEIRFNVQDGKEYSNTLLVGLYGLYRPADYYSLVDLVYGRSNNRLRRKINFSTSHYHAKSAPDAYQYSLYGELGLDYYLCDTLIQPFIGLEAAAFHRRHVNESGANGWNLIVKKSSHNFASTRVGLHWTADIFCLSLNLDLAWNRQLNHLKNQIRVRFADFGTTFAIKGIEYNQNSIDYALLLSSKLDNNWDIYLEGSGESWKHLNQFSMTGGINFRW